MQHIFNKNNNSTNSTILWFILNEQYAKTQRGKNEKERKNRKMSGHLDNFTQFILRNLSYLSKQNSNKRVNQKSLHRKRYNSIYVINTFSEYQQLIYMSISIAGSKNNNNTKIAQKTDITPIKRFELIITLFMNISSREFCSHWHFFRLINFFLSFSQLFKFLFSIFSFNAFSLNLLLSVLGAFSFDYIVSAKIKSLLDIIADQ